MNAVSLHDQLFDLPVQTASYYKSAQQLALPAGCKATCQLFESKLHLAEARPRKQGKSCGNMQKQHNESET